MSNQNPKMRAKVRVGAILPYPQPDGTVTSERLMLHGVAANRYPEDGSDENNSFAKFSPSVAFDMQVANPALIGTFKVGDMFYVDFIPVD
jgi:hypothetical protein